MSTSSGEVQCYTASQRFLHQPSLVCNYQTEFCGGFFLLTLKPEYQPWGLETSWAIFFRHAFPNSNAFAGKLCSLRNWWISTLLSLTDSTMPPFLWDVQICSWAGQALKGWGVKSSPSYLSLQRDMTTYVTGGQLTAFEPCKAWMLWEQVTVVGQPHPTT